MYTPEAFNVSDRPTLQSDMGRWEFATLIRPDAPAGRQVAHLPLLLDSAYGLFWYRGRPHDKGGPTLAGVQPIAA